MTRAYIVSLVRRILVLLLLILNATAYCDGVEAKPMSRQVRMHGGGNQAGGGGKKSARFGYWLWLGRFLRLGWPISI